MKSEKMVTDEECGKSDLMLLRRFERFNCMKLTEREKYIFVAGLRMGVGNMIGSGEYKVTIAPGKEKLR